MSSSFLLLAENTENLVINRRNKEYKNIYRYFISFLASGHFCCLMIAFANSLDPDQD